MEFIGNVTACIWQVCVLLFNVERQQQMDFFLSILQHLCYQYFVKKMLILSPIFVSSGVQAMI